jgi:UDP-3-O-[3-hydroxymyristoyl] glucosamine N-acyltransferase
MYVRVGTRVSVGKNVGVDAAVSTGVGVCVGVRVAIAVGVRVVVAVGSVVGIEVGGAVTTTLTTACAATPCPSYPVKVNWKAPAVAALNWVRLVVRLDRLTGEPAVCSQK